MTTLIVHYTGAFEGMGVERYPDRATALARWPAERDESRYGFIVERDDDLLGLALTVPDEPEPARTLTGAGLARIYNAFADTKVDGRFTNRTAGAKRTARMLLAKFAGMVEPEVPAADVVSFDIGQPSNTFEPPPSNLDKAENSHILASPTDVGPTLAAKCMENDMPEREYKIGEFKRVREDSKLGKIIKSIQVGGKDLVAVAADVGSDADDVEARLKSARRTHGINHTFSAPEEHLSLVLPPGTEDVLIPAATVKEKKTKVFNPPRLGEFSPVRGGSNLDAIINSIAAGGHTLESLAAKHGANKQRMNGILRHGLGVMHGIGHTIDINGTIALTQPVETLIKQPSAPRERTAPGERVQSKTQKAMDDANAGIAPPHLVITSVANAHRQKTVDRLEKLAADGNWDDVRAFHLNGIDSYSKMINRHRDLILAAYNAQQRRNEAAE